MELFKRLFHRHTWRPMKVMYRYREGGCGRQIAVKRCQCVVCGRTQNSLIGDTMFHREMKEQNKK